jgi:hypothetical protein
MAYGKHNQASPAPAKHSGPGAKQGKPNAGGATTPPSGTDRIRGFGDAAPGRGGNKFGPAKLGLPASPMGAKKGDTAIPDFKAPVSGAPQPRKDGRP